MKIIISPPGSASLDFEALDKLTLAAVTGVTVVMQAAGGTQINLSLDANGLGNSGSVDPAIYKGIAKAPNYQDLSFIKEVNKGTGAGLKLLMVKI